MHFNINNFKNKNWFWVLALTVVVFGLSGIAAFYSIFGLSSLFHAAGWTITALAGVLEVAKIVVVSYVYRFWKSIGWFKWFFTFCIVFIMFLTSVGVYGYLTGSYQKTANKVEYRDSQIKIMENRKALFVDQLDRINKAIESDNNRITQLTNLRSGQERRLDTLYNRRQVSAADRNLASISSQDEQIKFLNEDITGKMKETSSVNDSIAYYDIKIMELKNSDVSTEIGPYKFISDLTGAPMDKIVNWITLMIILVCDPLSIGLLIGLNRLTTFEKEEEKKEDKEKNTEKKEDKIEKIEPVLEKEPIKEESIKEPIKEEPVKEFLATTTYHPIYKEEEDQEEEIEQAEEIDLKKNEPLLKDCPDGYTEEKVELIKTNIIEGLRVYHNTFGKGIIIKSDLEKNRVLIQFDEMGIKELNPDYANLSEIICIKKDEEIEAVPYLEFSVDDPQIQDILIRKPNTEETPEEPIIEENITEEIKPEQIESSDSKKNETSSKDLAWEEADIEEDVNYVDPETPWILRTVKQLRRIRKQKEEDIKREKNDDVQSVASIRTQKHS